MIVARGELLSIKDWWFRFEYDMDSTPPALWGEALRLQRMRELNSKPLVAINYKTGKVRHFPTQKIAADELSVNQSEVWAVVNGNSHSAGGWWFRYEDDDRLMPISYGTSAARRNATERSMRLI